LSNELQSIPSSVAELRSIDFNTLKAQEVGLNLLLLSLAQKQAARVKKLASVIDKLEEHIFDENIITDLTPAEQMQRYQLAIQATQTSTTYIKDTIKSINWDDIESRIMILEQQNISSSSNTTGINNSDLQAAALSLLSKLSQE